MRILKVNSSFDMILIVSFLIIAIANESLAGEADLEQVKNRRGGTAGLFAFPRVGRNDPNLSSNWLIPGSYEEYDDFPRMQMKRAGLVPFPRVGRADNQLIRNWSKLAALQQEQQMDKKSDYDRGLSYAERLGSRFGKIQKRSTQNYESPITGEHL